MKATHGVIKKKPTTTKRFKIITSTVAEDMRV